MVLESGFPDLLGSRGHFWLVWDALFGLVLDKRLYLACFTVVSVVR